MRSGLFWKLFLLQMVAAATLLGGSLAVTRAFTERHFTEFIEKREQAQVHDLAEQLAKAYARTPDLLKAAETVPMLWRRLHMPRRALFCDGPDCPPREGMVFGFSAEAPPDERALPDEPPPPPDVMFEGPEPPPDAEMGVDTAEEPADGGPARVMRFRTQRGAGAIRIDGPMPPLVLLDAGGQQLLGPRVPVSIDMEREPVSVEGKIVGYLARPPMRRPPELLEFSRQEMRHLRVVGPVALTVAVLFALVITALIVRPIRALSAGTAALTRREFGTRLDETRRDELGQLAADFNRMAAALEGYDSRQRQWLADVAHELRTPLSVLRGEVEAVLDGVRPVGPETMRSLKQEVGRLEALVQDLQLVSLAESGGLRLNRADTDLGELARSSVERFAESLGGRGFKVALALESDLRVSVDAQRLEQVLGNLLGNVLAHASPPGPITLAAHREGARVVLSVADAGPGVPLEALPRLFDRLYRVESARTRASGGAGLGLSICKSIVEAHGGTIAAQRSADGGLEIVIRL